MAILESPPVESLTVTEETKAELIRQLELGGDMMHRAISSIRGSVLKMALEPFGCRVVQVALDVAGPTDKDSLVSELHDHVRLAITSPHANFVIQKVIEVLPAKSASFVAEEMLSFVVEAAQHRYGCRVLCRLVEHHLCGGLDCSATTDLIDRLLLKTEQLIHHNFARHVLDLILEHGGASQRQHIAKTIRRDVYCHAKNRYSSYVVEKALTLCSATEAASIACDLLATPEQFLTLAVHECGMHVVKSVVKLHAECGRQAKDLLLANAERVASTKYGKRLLEDM
jgi:hypothetical protein